MRIAVIADTHDRYPLRFPERLAGADEIWHLGDVCEPDTLVEFRNLEIPMQVVIGNNEMHDLWPESLRLERGGRRFYLIHIPPRRVPPGTHVVLHGHTHVPRDEVDGDGVRWLNPGCITRPNRGSPPSFGWLTITPGEPIRWQLEHV